MNKKLNDRVEFPNTLNMRPYMKDEVLKQEKEAIDKARKNQRQKKKEEAALAKKAEDAKEEEDMQMQESEQEGEDDVEMTLQPDEDFEYKLVGVVLHMGTADAGHYLSYININRGDKDEETPEWLLTDKEKWLEFNDSQVKHYSFNSLEADCFGGGNPNQISGDQVFDYSKNAYMLIYEKRRKNPLKFVIPEQLVQKNETQMMINTEQMDSETLTQTKVTLSVSPDDIHSLCPEIRADQL